jgi:hypothetical protein
MTDSHSKEQILKEISQIQRMEPGKLSPYHLKNRPGKSGPYYKLQHHENGKNRTQYVRPEDVPLVQSAIDGYNKFEQLVCQYSQIVIQQTRDERCGGVKKKRRISSSHKTRKSSSS